MWNWFVQNREWVFSGIGVAFAGGIWWLLKKAFSGSGEHPANAASQSLNQSPTVSVSPTFNIQQSPSKHNDSAISPKPDTSPKLRPNLMCVGTRTTRLDFQQSVWVESEDGDFSAVAIMANRPDEVGAAPAFNVTAQVIFRKGREEIYQTLGAWVGHFSNKADFRAGEQQKLVIAVLDESDGTVYSMGNKRSAPRPSRARQAIRALEQNYRTQRTLTDDCLDIEITLLSPQGHVLCRFELRYEKQEDGFKVSLK